MYSYSGIQIISICIFLVFEAVSLIWTKRLLQLTTLLKTFAWISAAISLFLFIAALALILHEGSRLRRLLGPALGSIWVLGNIFCLMAERNIILPTWFKTFLAIYGCYIDLLLTGILTTALIAAKHMPAYNKDFIIIPGCSISKKGGLLPLLKGRTNRAIRFAWDQERASGKPAHYIPSGGQGKDEIMSEGSAMEMYLISHGAEQYEVFPEKASVNTYENMLFSKKIIDKIQPASKVCFVTSDYHVLRSGLLAKQVGIDAEGLGSKTKWYFWPNGLAREIIAILAMYPKLQVVSVLICAVTAVILTYLKM